MPISDPYSYSDASLCEVLFERLEQLRLEQNISQSELAEEIGITPKTYRNIATGNAKFAVIIGALRVLGQLHHLDNFIPEVLISPIEMVKLKGNTRKHAYKKKTKEKSTTREELDW